MPTLASRRLMVGLCLGAVLLSGCTRIRDHKGYVVDSTLVESVQPGVDNRDSVMKTLGRPSFASEFDDGATWYYLSRETRQFAFTNPKPVQQVLLAVHFTKTGDVLNVKKTGTETIANVTPYGKKTPTLGRNRGFFADLFGNIGAGGANATRAPTADNPTNR
ncbi:outer membrane protein assembly factor BamE [Sphingomonas sp. AP4-R1]|uniref:outer membrane protein assembly factor BamE n=1 Tax=Sphingomonas sp. AP4-R1 TaxID=2735134 RepID=UPI0014938ACC|nr:outer membrane protein assembly factor BamE [Sphingomonas sp. AP4-R1]QJU60004.1 outer membrane protein assembly factor BamE [Sphingomonas sp. AP4-R1]